MQRTLTRAIAGLFAMMTVTLPIKAAEWPQDKPIRMIVPFEPAGLVDVIGRMLATHLSEELGQTVFIENRGGAGGKNGSIQAMRAPADGYTLLLSGLASHVIAPLVSDVRPYDGVKDFSHIAYLSGPPLVIAVSRQSGLTSFADIVSKAREAKVDGYASAGVGTLSHIIMETALKQNSVTIPHVPYNTAALNDMIAGRVPVGVFSYAPVAAQSAAGNVKMVALSTGQRHPAAADVPTLKELGYDIVAPSWVALSAPAGLDPAIIRKLNEATNKILKRADVQKKLFEDAINVETKSPQETVAFIQAETTAWTQRMRSMGMLK